MTLNEHKRNIKQLGYKFNRVNYSFGVNYRVLTKDNINIKGSNVYTEDFYNDHKTIIHYINLHDKDIKQLLNID